MRLDSRDCFPSGMEEYLSKYGWHFSKRMAEWAASNMYKKVGNKKEYITPYTKEQLDSLFANYGIHIDTKGGYDYVYLANMCKADYLNSSIIDEVHLLQFITDTLNDPDAHKGQVFTRFYADCIGSGTPIIWEDMI